MEDKTPPALHIESTTRPQRCGHKVQLPGLGKDRRDGRWVKRTRGRRGGSERSVVSEREGQVCVAGGVGAGEVPGREGMREEGGRGLTGQWG